MDRGDDIGEAMKRRGGSSEQKEVGRSCERYSQIRAKEIAERITVGASRTGFNEYRKLTSNVRADETKQPMPPIMRRASKGHKILLVVVRACHAYRPKTCERTSDYLEDTVIKTYGCFRTGYGGSIPSIPKTRRGTLKKKRKAMRMTFCRLV